MRRQDTLYCNICNGLIILPSPAFMTANKVFVDAHVATTKHQENKTQLLNALTELQNGL